MAQDSKIEWTTHTFNPWRGCTKVSAGCKNCYADTLSKRNPSVLGIWGPKGTRVIASESMWREPIKWNDDAKKRGVRERVFCASLADVFEGWETMPVGVYSMIRNARARLFRLIEATPSLDWLLLTKRPENIIKQVREVYDDCLVEPGKWLPANVWLGTSVENQATADERIPHLLRVPAAVRFLSMEPLLMPVNIRSIEIDDEVRTVLFPLTGEVIFEGRNEPAPLKGGGIHWVIVGGESGPNARPCNIDYIRSVVEQCWVAGVPVFVKQLGARLVDHRIPADWRSGWPEGSCRDERGHVMILRDPKGGDMSEWPEDVRVRQMPKAGQAALQPGDEVRVIGPTASGIKSYVGQTGVFVKNSQYVGAVVALHDKSIGVCYFPHTSLDVWNWKEETP
jgi:protein gp37